MFQCSEILCAFDGECASDSLYDGEVVDTEQVSNDLLEPTAC